MGGEFNFSERSGLGDYFSPVDRQQILDDAQRLLGLDTQKRPTVNALHGSLRDLNDRVERVERDALYNARAITGWRAESEATLRQIAQVRSMTQAAHEEQGELHAHDVTNLRSNMTDAYCRAVSRIEKLEAESAERARIVAAFADGTSRRDSTTPPPARQAWAPVKWALLGAAVASLASAALIALTGL